MKWRRAVDLVMMALLVLLMAYSLVGEEAHEWIGLSLFALVTVHHILNRIWWRILKKRKVNAFSRFQRAVVMLLVVSMLGAMASGIYLSRYVFSSFFPEERNLVYAQRIHLLCAYWGFVLMGVHLGLHGRAIFGGLCKKNKVLKYSLSAVFIGIAALGYAASVRRQFWLYLFNQNHFFAVFNVSRTAYLLDYLAILLMFSVLGFCLSEALRREEKRKKRKQIISHGEK